MSAVRDVLKMVFAASVQARDPHGAASSLERLEAYLQRSDATQQRETLRNLLTMLEVDLPEEVCAAVDALILSERSPPVPWQSLQFALTSERTAVWRGDITTLQIDGIVNAANDRMLGCFKPGHKCIDNVIHDKAGPRLRMECRQLMQKQGHLEPTGSAKITQAYCLPCKHVIHTVGPICEDHVPRPRELESSYRACLDIARTHGLRTIAFCCISTGVFGYPGQPAAQCALQTVHSYIAQHPDAFDLVLFNVFTAKDFDIYQAEFPRVFRVGPLRALQSAAVAGTP